jgi:hypothetical protein
MDKLVLPDGIHFALAKLAELVRLFTECWEAVVARRPDLALHHGEDSLRNTIASRIITGAADGVDDIEELRRRALFGILP